VIERSGRACAGIDHQGEVGTLAAILEHHLILIFQRPPSKPPTPQPIQQFPLPLGQWGCNQAELTVQVLSV
jgi:hypothetical protein